MKEVTVTLLQNRQKEDNLRQKATMLEALIEQRAASMVCKENTVQDGSIPASKLQETKAFKAVHHRIVASLAFAAATDLCCTAFSATVSQMSGNLYGVACV